MVLGLIFVSLAAQLLMNQGFFYCRGWEGGVFMSNEAVFPAAVGILFFWRSGPMALLDWRSDDLDQHYRAKPVKIDRKK